jgi:hypothetical protein
MTGHTEALDVLRQERRRVRSLPLVWALAASLCAGAASLAVPLGWWPRGGYAAAALAIASLVGVGLWLRRLRRTTDRNLAEELDTEWRLQSRLEATMELRERTTAIAAALRADTTRRVSTLGQGRDRPWLAGVIAAALALGLVVVQGSILGVRVWRRAAASAADAQSPGADASIAWRSPESEIKATAIEEVPFTARAESTTGFRALSLEVAVNGEPRPSRPLSSSAIEAARSPGGHDVSEALYLDELGAKEYDIVSYHLRGEYGDAAAPRSVVSPLQFVQVRSLRPASVRASKASDEREGAGASGEDLRARLGELKLEQLQLLERTFGLGHGGGDRQAPLKEQAHRLSSEQAALSAKTREVGALAAHIRAPALAVENLKSAASRMDEAGEALQGAHTDEATRLQGRALALITECEKIFEAAAGEGGGTDGNGSPNPDPFTDRQAQQELTPREKTPAGQLEQLARRQRQANTRPQNSRAGSDKSSSSDGANSEGSGLDAREQAAIASEAEALARGGTVDGDSRQHLGEAMRSALRAARHLDQGDPQAAHEPAAAAEVALEHAVEAQDRIGRLTAVAELDRAQRELNAASRMGGAEARATALARIQSSLRAAAERQQKAGSAEAARKLVELSRASATTPERAREIAAEAARAQVALSPRAEAFNRPIRQLGRATQTPEGAGLEPILGELEVASQHAEWLTHEAAVLDVARKLAAQSDRLQRQPGNDPAALREVATAAVRLAAALEAARSIGRRDEVVRHFNPDDIDPAYRAAIDAYFERLSREARGHAHPH